MALERFFVNDTAVVEAFCFEEDGETPSDCSSVSWNYLKPGALASLSADVATPGNISLAEGATLTNMTGTFEYLFVGVNGQMESVPAAAQSITVANKRVEVTYPIATGGVLVRRIYRRKSPSTTYRLLATVGSSGGVHSDTLLEDPTTGRTPFFVPGTGAARQGIADTDAVGLYRATATFTKADGTIKTIPLTFTIEDPLEIASNTDLGQTLDLAWMLLEDCFDSELGGPWLRDVTLRNFDRAKLAGLVQNAFYIINVTPPMENWDETSFPYEAARPLLAKGILIEAIKHLQRSYVEQPLVTGAGQISYFDRRDYMARWGEILKLEREDFKAWLALFKRDAYNFGSSKVLVDIKAGRRLMVSPNLRLRYPRLRLI